MSVSAPATRPASASSAASPSSSASPSGVAVGGVATSGMSVSVPSSPSGGGGDGRGGGSSENSSSVSSSAPVTPLDTPRLSNAHAFGMECSASILRHEIAGNFVVYVAEVLMRGTVWQIKRRFSDFATLAEVLRRLERRNKAMSVPGTLKASSQLKGLFSDRFDEDFIQGRKAELQLMLDGICGRGDDVLMHKAVRRFFEIDAHVVVEHSPITAMAVAPSTTHSAAEAVDDFDHRTSGQHQHLHFHSHPHIGEGTTSTPQIAARHSFDSPAPAVEGGKNTNNSGTSNNYNNDKKTVVMRGRGRSDADAAAAALRAESKDSSGADENQRNAQDRLGQSTGSQGAGRKGLSTTANNAAGSEAGRGGETRSRSAADNDINNDRHHNRDVRGGAFGRKLTSGPPSLPFRVGNGTGAGPATDGKKKLQTFNYGRSPGRRVAPSRRNNTRRQHNVPGRFTPPSHADRGSTDVCGGEFAVWKSDTLIEACGALEELCASLGTAREYCLVNAPKVAPRLLEIQHRLCDLSIILSRLHCDESPIQALRDNDNIEIAELAASIDRIVQWTGELTELVPPVEDGVVILPSGGFTATQLHSSRMLCRKAERRLVGILRPRIHRSSSEDPAGDIVAADMLTFLNRLDWFLFLCARYSAVLGGHSETARVQPDAALLQQSYPVASASAM